jgi:hypothetical protein
MGAAEMTLKSATRITDPNLALNGLKYYHIQGKGATNSDYFTVGQLTTVKGCSLMATDGTVGTVTFSTNVITVTNASTLYWGGLVWGV